MQVINARFRTTIKVQGIGFVNEVKVGDRVPMESGGGMVSEIIVSQSLQSILIRKEREGSKSRYTPTTGKTWDVTVVPLINISSLAGVDEQPQQQGKKP